MHEREHGRRIMRSEMATGSNKIRLKLLVNKESRKVMFAEGGKEFVDFLFGLLEMPVGCIAYLLMEHGMHGPGAGPLGRVYQSAKNLDCSYVEASPQRRDWLLMPMPPPSNAVHIPLLRELAFNGAVGVGGKTNNTAGVGYVKGVVSYMVMDDLEVKPMSTISSIALLNTFNVKDVGCLEEKTVEIGIVKGLELAKASFVSTTVLTDVFLKEENSS